MVFKLFNKLVWLVNLIVATGLIALYLAPFISPSTFWPLSIGGLVYPLLLILNIAFVLYWILRRKWRFLLSLLAILIGWTVLNNYFAFNLNKKQEATEEKASIQPFLKVMSYNVQNFDLYNWKENEASRDSMLVMIEKESPDVIAFQEFYSEDNDDFHNVKKIINEMGYKDHFLKKTLTIEEKHHWGIALFSKFPLENKEVILFPNAKNNTAMSVDVTVDGQTVRIFNTHLQSIHLGPADYKYIKKVSSGEANWKGSLAILQKLKKAFQKRGTQAEILRASIDQSPHPVIVMGDFNDTAISYTYKTIAGSLQDAFLTKGWGIGSTFSGPLPYLRIDYVLVDPVFEISSFEVIEKKFSDHYPVSCVIAW